jgi:hypothetical protein
MALPDGSQAYDAAAYAAAGYSSRAEYEQHAAAYAAGGAWQEAGGQAAGGWGGNAAHAAHGARAGYNASADEVRSWHGPCSLQAAACARMAAHVCMLTSTSNMCEVAAIILN